MEKKDQSISVPLSKLLSPYLLQQSESVVDRWMEIYTVTVAERVKKALAEVYQLLVTLPPWLNHNQGFSNCLSAAYCFFQTIISQAPSEYLGFSYVPIYILYSHCHRYTVITHWYTNKYGPEEHWKTKVCSWAPLMAGTVPISVYPACKPQCTQWRVEVHAVTSSTGSTVGL